MLVLHGPSPALQWAEPTRALNSPKAQDINLGSAREMQLQWRGPERGRRNGNKG